MRKLLIGILALIMFLSLAACAQKEPQNSAPSTEPSNITVAPTQPAPAPQIKWLLQSETYVYEDASMGTVVVTYHYDSLGNCLSVCQQMDGTTMDTVLHYDEAGRNTGMTVTQGETTMRYEYTLDKQGNRIQTQIFNGKSLLSTQNCTYDTNGNPLTVENISQLYTSRTEYTYDANGHVRSYNTYTDGELTSIVTIAYDEQGRQIRATATDPQGNIVSVTDVVFDGNTETQTRKDANGAVLSTVVKTRDEQGNVVAVSHTSSNTPSYTYTATYTSIEIPASK